MQNDTIPVSGPSRLYPPAAFGLTLLVTVVCASGAVLNDGDTFTHISAGRWMMQHLLVLTRDPFTSTFAGQPWTAHEWLSEILFGAAYKVAGLSGVVLLAAAAAAITLSNLARHIGQWCSWQATMLLTSGALLCVIPSVLARPHVLALPLLEMWVAGLVLARREKRAPRWWLLLAMTAWANLHGGYAFGVVFAGVFAVETMITPGRRSNVVWHWWAFAAGSVAAAMATPQGWNGLLFPIQLLRLHSLSYVQEWQQVDFAQQFGVEGVVLALLALLGSGKVRIPWFRLLLLIGLLHLSINHSRHMLLFGIAGALILAEPVERAFPILERVRVGRGSTVSYWAGAALVAVLRLAVPITHIDARVTPVSAIAQLPPTVTRLPMLNSTQFGGYLELVGLHPFVDGRVELFGDAFIDEYLAMSRADGTSLRRGVDRYGIEWALLAVDDPLVGGFDGLAGWRRQYADGVAVVFVRG